jgi:RND family efflux transporter MFP subunit
MLKRILFALSLLSVMGVAAGGALWIAHGSDQPANPPPASPPGSVAPAAPADSTWVETVPVIRGRVVDIPGLEIWPYEKTELLAKIPGYVQEISVDVGTRIHGAQLDSSGKLVKEADVLVRISVPELVKDEEQKVALVGQAEAEIQQSKAALAAAEKRLSSSQELVKVAEAARLRAQAELRRAQAQYDGLVKSKAAVTAETLAESQYALEAANAGLAEAEAKVASAKATAEESAANRDKAKADVKAAEEHLKVAIANRDRVAEMLRYAKIPAPYDGVVTQRNLHTGAFVSGTMADKPLLTVVRTDRLRAVLDIPEKDAPFLAVGDPVEVKLDAMSKEKFNWKINRFAPILGGGKKVRAEIDVENRDDHFYPGMYGRAAVILQGVEVFTIPETCLDKESTFVWTVVDGTATKRKVTVGPRDGKKAEITSGLTEKDEVTSAGKDGLKEGQTVQVRKPNEGKKE